MNAKKLKITEAVRHFSDYISRVAYRREVFVLCKGRKAMAELRPVPMNTRLGDLPEILASLPPLSAREAAAFAEDIQCARNDIKEKELISPWDS